MGIFAVARLARLPNEQLLDPICGMPGAVSGPKLGTLIHCSSFKEGSFHEKEKPHPDGKRHCLLCKKRDGQTAADGVGPQQSQRPGRTGR